MTKTQAREDHVSDAITGELRAEMARKRITGTELAQRMKWTQVYLSRRLTGTVPLTFSEVVDLAQELEIPLERIMKAAKDAIKRRFSHLGSDLRFHALASAF